MRRADRNRGLGTDCGGGVVDIAVAIDHTIFIDTVAINNRLLDIVSEAEALVGADRQGRNRADLTGGVRHGNG